jgi:hypothetical protein
MKKIIEFLLSAITKISVNPSHQEILDKTDSIKDGSDVVNRAVMIQKRRYSMSLLKLQKQARIIQASADKLSEEIDTAVAIAISTGRVVKNE